MIRVIVGLFFFAVVVAAAVFFADRPGQVDIVWQGWEVGTSVGVLVAAAVLFALGLALLFWVASLIVGSPRAFLRRRRERRRRAGYRALSQGMVAVAAGDPQEAQRYARRADTLLADPPLTLLLSAQAAQLEGDNTAAKKFFTAMLDRPETEFLGLRGLLNEAMRAGDRSTALHLAQRAIILRPNTPWLAESLFDLEVREGRWEVAHETLARAVKRRMVPRERARHQRGVILYELGLAALGKGDRRSGIRLAARAQALIPDLATPAAHHARLLLQDGRTGSAAKTVERAWRTAANPELAQVYGAIHNGEAPLARVKCFERLAAQNPTARESYITLAEAALEAQLWGEARRYLEQALAAAAPPAMAKLTDHSSFHTPVAALLHRRAIPRSTSVFAGDGRSMFSPAAEGAPKEAEEGHSNVVAGPTPRLCLLMARLEEAEHGSVDGVRQWLDRAVGAMPDPRYVCASCGGERFEWRSFCPNCGSFDKLAWRTPAWAAVAGTLPITREPRPAPEISTPGVPELPVGN